MRWALVAASTLLLGGCALFVPDPVYKRWNNEVSLPAWGAPTLALASTPVEPASATRLKDLPPETGAAYVTALASKTDNADALRRALGGAVAPDKGASDRTTIVYSRALLVSLDRPALRPGDRMMATTVTIRPVNFLFTDFVAAETSYSTVAIEKVTTSTGVGASAKLSPTLKADLVGTGEIGATASASRQEAYELSERYDGLTVTPASDRLVIKRRGAVGIDLTGNTVVRVSLKPAGKAAEDQSSYWMVVRGMKLREGGKDLDKAGAVLDLFLEKAPPPTPLIACASLTYVDRVVEAGAEFYDESRQKVHFAQGSVPETAFALASVDEMVPPLWTVRMRGFALKIATSRGDQEFGFTDPTDASLFLNWARRQKADAVGQNRLMAGDPGGGALDWAAAQVSVLRAIPSATAIPSGTCDKR